jgi:hypothetical protein
MNNTKALQLIADCNTELNDIKGIMKKISPFDNTIPYLTNYAIIKACGTIEQSFKTIIADYCQKGQNAQVTNYIHNTFRESSLNPSYDNICRSLSAFDAIWHDSFKKRVSSRKNKDKLITSLKSLNQARNTFAHGNTTTISFRSVVQYFNDSLKIIRVLDMVIK